MSYMTIAAEHRRTIATVPNESVSDEWKNFESSGEKQPGDVCRFYHESARPVCCSLL